LPSRQERESKAESDQWQDLPIAREEICGTRLIEAALSGVAKKNAEQRKSGDQRRQQPQPF
jgi:hypothetical protein